MKKTWIQKIEDKPNFPKILKLEKGFPCYNAVHKMGAEEGDSIVLVNPSEILPFMTEVLKGKIITLFEICKQIAIRYKVKGCCTLTTGIFIMSIANAIKEAKSTKNSPDLVSIPYWRTLKSEGYLNEKYPGGIEALIKLLTKEGYKIRAKGKKYQVFDYEKYLIQFY